MILVSLSFKVVLGSSVKVSTETVWLKAKVETAWLKEASYILAVLPADF